MCRVSSATPLLTFLRMPWYKASSGDNAYESKSSGRGEEIVRSQIFTRLTTILLSHFSLPVALLCYGIANGI